MSNLPRSLLDLKSVPAPAIEKLFSLSRKAKKGELARAFADSSVSPIISLIFFEPSTRTQQSFTYAAHRAGLTPVTFEAGKTSSTVKGESFLDTCLNVTALGPVALVVRAGDEHDLEELRVRTGLPIINGGWGRRGHPTQALLDFFALSEHRPLKGTRICYLGDIDHSRVASSHFELAASLGMESAVCGPEELLQTVSPQVRRFGRLEEAIEWADVVMALRYQVERHESSDSERLQGYARQYGLNDRHLPMFGSEKYIMHPGPVNHGVELTSTVYFHRQSLILRQVQHGVWLRQALITALLSGDWP